MSKNGSGFAIMQKLGQALMLPVAEIGRAHV